MSLELVEKGRTTSRGFLEEVYWVIGHLVNLEEHLYEASQFEAAREVAGSRRAVMRELLRASGREDEEFVKAWWCVVKHACALLVHMEECVAASSTMDELLRGIHSDLLNLLNTLLSGERHE